MRILGIDPGTATTGFGIIEVTGGRFRPLNFGHIQTEKTYSQAERLDQIAYDLALLCQQWRPTACAVEKLFFSKNVKTAMVVAEARGVILQTLKRSGYPIFEYNPGEIKMAITGYGKATKDQIQKMVVHHLQLKQIPKPDDAADALAIALCHAHHSRYQQRVATPSS
ncbi:MAG: Crossover junction endodeoxyribonuclease RuvC [uncultured bacterium]|nr:MAG: Crossover junction endodeoxyribonuclease RuvC [uncultured bacterium]